MGVRGMRAVAVLPPGAPPALELRPSSHGLRPRRCGPGRGVGAVHRPGRRGAARGVGGDGRPRRCDPEGEGRGRGGGVRPPRAGAAPRDRAAGRAMGVRCCAARSGTCPRSAPPTPPATSPPPTWRSSSARTGPRRGGRGRLWSSANSRTPTGPAAPTATPKSRRRRDDAASGLRAALAGLSDAFTARVRQIRVVDVLLAHYARGL